MGDEINLRRATAAEWTAENPTLRLGEPGFETDTGWVKVGDGTTAWTSLSYIIINGLIWTEELTAGENVVAGDWCYLKTSDQKMWKTDADAEATSIGFVAVATETINADATGTFHHMGRWTTTGLTAGSIYYLSTTAGAITTTKPSGSGDIVREIGQALSTTVLIVDVDKSYLEI